MKKDYTDITLVLDESGSMQSIATDVIGGINDFISKQKEVQGTAKISLVTFASNIHMPYDGLDISKFPVMTPKDYRPTGWTALYDGIGSAIDRAGNRFSQMIEEDRPDKVIIAIMTDGQENNSRLYSHSQIKEMITLQTEVYNWQFVYLGANQDSFAVGRSLNIASASTDNYDPTPWGTQIAMSSLNSAVASYRTGNTNSVRL